MADDSNVTFDNLVGKGPIKTFDLTLASGQKVVRGEVLGYNTSTNKIETFDSGGSNGVNVFYAIAIDDIDATASDLRIAVYVGGEFLIGGLTFSVSGDTADQPFINQARSFGVFLKTAVSA